MVCLSNTLRGLNKLVRQWEKVKKVKIKDRIKFIRAERTKILSEVEEGGQKYDFWDRINSLEVEYRSHLLKEEQ